MEKGKLIEDLEDALASFDRKAEADDRPDLGLVHDILSAPRPEPKPEKPRREPVRVKPRGRGFDWRPMIAEVFRNPGVLPLIGAGAMGVFKGLVGFSKRNRWAQTRDRRNWLQRVMRSGRGRSSNPSWGDRPLNYIQFDDQESGRASRVRREIQAQQNYEYDLREARRARVAFR